MLRALFVQLATDVCLAVGAICANRTALATNTMSSCESGFSNKRPDSPPPPPPRSVLSWVVMPRLHESGPFQSSYGQPRETIQHLLGPI